MTWRVAGTKKFVRELHRNDEGYVLTTCGVFKKDELIEADSPCITYNSDSCTELPVNWAEHEWLDDNNKRQKIKVIRFGEEPAYLMEDDTLSREVTE